MAKRIEYGQTWWGKQWLNALSSIDLSNRIPRGKSYANKGAVQDFKISKGTISAKVQGSEYYPYQQKITLTPFTTMQKNIILSVIREEISILAVLLNRQLPPDLDVILLSENIQLFPKDWRSLTMTCSCPDYAVPCKHLAAVIYMIANEIDKNPFLLFELRGLSLLNELEKYGVLQFKTEEAQEFFKFKDFVLGDDQEIYAGQVSPEKFNDLSFALPMVGLQSIEGILDNATLFYSDGSFKDTLKELYKNTHKYCARLFKQKTEKKENSLHQRLLACDNLYLNLSNDGYLDDVWLYSNLEDTVQSLFDKKTGKIANLMALLEATPLDELWQYPNEWIALYSIYRFTENLVLTGNFMPRLVKVNASYRIQWLPADINPTVKNSIQNILDFCSGDLLVWTSEEELGLTFEPIEQLRTIADLFIGEWLSEACQGFSEKKRDADAKVLDCFVNRKTIKFDKLGEKETPGSIQMWLRKLYMVHKRYVPLIRIEEEGYGFSLKLQIEDRQDAEILPVDWEIFLADEAYRDHLLPTIQDVQLHHLYSFAQSRRDRLEFDRCQPCDSLRFVVESRGRISSNRPCLSHWSAKKCDGLSLVV